MIVVGFGVGCPEELLGVRFDHGDDAVWYSEGEEPVPEGSIKDGLEEYVTACEREAGKAVPVGGTGFYDFVALYLPCQLIEVVAYWYAQGSYGGPVRCDLGSEGELCRYQFWMPSELA